ncbi:hypothetical protein RRG08_012101 [Elysia crispata]|uniref:Uncharacterized protein n=1 Tax=Elysia crispata TaxID=231223 RepID=A0AAE1AT84_9GAST|nr:hypothetical protein RRG08_012101 [Elysia crispata]
MATFHHAALQKQNTPEKWKNVYKDTIKLEHLNLTGQLSVSSMRCNEPKTKTFNEFVGERGEISMAQTNRTGQCVPVCYGIRSHDFIEKDTRCVRQCTVWSHVFENTIKLTCQSARPRPLDVSSGSVEAEEEFGRINSVTHAERCLFPLRYFGEKVHV